MIYEDSWVDAQEKAKKAPFTFFAPSISELEDIKAGSIVKICNGDERFWVTVNLISDEDIIGTIDNDLLGNNPYKCGDKVKFHKNNIYDIYNDSEQDSA